MNLGLIKQLARHIENERETEFEALSRRQWLRNLGMVSASGLVLVACGSEDQKTQRTSTSLAKANDKGSNENTSAATGATKDAGLLNAALRLEHEAIALYTAAAGLDFMKKDDVKPILTIAGTFLSHHEAHRALLISGIKKINETTPDSPKPEEAKDASEYVNPVASKLTDVKMVLRLAALKESEAAKAYFGIISGFSDKTLVASMGMLGGDEAGHYGALRAALFAVIQDSDVTAETVIPASLAGGFKQTF